MPTSSPAGRDLGGASAPLSVSVDQQPLAATSRLATPGDYVSLLKPRVMSLAIFTALAGMVAAPGPVPSWPLALLSLLAIAIGAGASGALNMWWDADIDGVMSRTRKRAIPEGRVPRAEAFAFGGLLSLLSVWLLALTANYVAAALLAGTILFYIVIYTMGLKRSTPQNIVIGGAAGALPPVVGWAAVTGNVPIDAWVLFAIIFFWTPPHFWALALVKSADYDAAGIPMMPNVRGAVATRRQIWWYTVLLVPVTLLPFIIGTASWLYGAVAVGASAAMLKDAWLLSRQPSDKQAWALFRVSIFFLFGVFLALIIEHWLGLNG